MIRDVSVEADVQISLLSLSKSSARSMWYVRDISVLHASDGTGDWR